MPVGTISDYLENRLGDHLLNAVAYTPATTIYVGYSTADPTDAGSGLAEPSGNGYSRKAITFDAASSRAINSNAVTFDAATGSQGTITHYFLSDSGTTGGGNLLASAALSSSKVIVSGNTPSIADNEIVISFEPQNYTVASIDATANTFTITGVNGALAADTRVYISAATTLAAPLAADTVYWVVGVSGNTVQLSATQGGAAIDLTNTGTGTHTIARVSNISNYLANALLDFAFRNQSFSSPSTYVGLATANLSDSSTGATANELAATNAYARRQVNANGGASPTWDLASGGMVDNGAAVSLTTATGAWSAFTAAFVADSATNGAGNVLLYDNSVTPNTVGSGDTVRFTAGNLALRFA
jgi:hypothetical protein